MPALRAPVRAAAANGLGRFRVEVRDAEGKRRLWTSRAIPASRLEDAVGEMIGWVARRLRPEQRARAAAHPAHLACWLLKTGHGRLSEIEGRTYAHVAEVVLGAPSGMSAIEDEGRPEWRAVRAHVAAAEKLIASRRASRQVSQR